MSFTWGPTTTSLTFPSAPTVSVPQAPAQPQWPSILVPSPSFIFNSNTDFGQLDDASKSNLVRIQDYLDEELKAAQEVEQATIPKIDANREFCELLSEKLNTANTQIKVFTNITNQIKDSIGLCFKHIHSVSSASRDFQSLPSPFFVNLLKDFDKKMKECKALITEVERHLSFQDNYCNPVVLREVVKNQYACFITLAARVSELHNLIEDLKVGYLQYRSVYFGDHSDPFQALKKKDKLKSFEARSLINIPPAQAAAPPTQPTPTTWGTYPGMPTTTTTAAPTSTPSTGLTFGSTPGFSFSANPNPTPTPTTTGFSFGTSAPTTTSAPSGFSFASTPNTTSTTTGGTGTGSFNFGTSGTTGGNTGFNFGTTPTNTTTGGNGGSTGFNFGTTPSTGATGGGTSFNFGTSTSGSTGGTGFNFGTTPTTTTTTTGGTGGFSFGNPTSTAPTTTSFFSNPSSTPSTGGFNFGSTPTSTTAPTSTGTGFNFGTTSTGTTGGTSTGGFGGFGGFTTTGF